MVEYKHFISLGYFCSVALELERIGLRSCSSPFDWTICKIQGVKHAIESHFENFLEYDNMSQCQNNHLYYRDDLYDIYFFHDFDKYISLANQLESVKHKYERRIDKFYKDICEPTLFVRYIDDINEFQWLQENYNVFISLLKKFNNKNDIVFIANSFIPDSNKFKIYKVEKDENDGVARKFLDKNDELLNRLNGYDFLDKESNIKFYNSKQRNKNRIMTKFIKGIKIGYNKIFHKEYVHNKQYCEDVQKR